MHSIAGQLVLEGLKDSKLRTMIEANRKTYNLGCQGPDLFYYNDFLPWIKNKRGPKIGTIIHQKNTKSLFLESIDYLKNTQGHGDFMALASYFSGFIVHYTIDSHGHPFINARTKNFPEHKVLEMNLDIYFMEKYWNQRAYLISPLPTINIGKKLPSIIVEFYKNIVSKVYGISLDDRVVNDSYKDYQRFFNISYAPKKTKRFFLGMLNAILPIDISIYTYDDNADNEFLSKDELLEFEDLLMTGVSEGVKLIELIDSYLRGEIEKEPIAKSLSDISFSGKPSKND